MKLKLLTDDLNYLSGKTVLLRLDLNVPLYLGKITDDYKLRLALPTIKLLHRAGCKIIIVTHWGEPPLATSKKIIKQWSVKPIAHWLSKNLSLPVKLLPLTWKEINLAVRQTKTKDILMMENIRLFKGEVNNSQVLAFKLASLAKVYVNDAFAVAHRSHASVDRIKNYLPALAGPLLAAELNNLTQASQGKKPLVLIMGGAKLSTKLPLLKKMSPLASVILVGGGLANTVLQARGQTVGRSLVDTKGLVSFKKLNLKNIICPVDVAVAYQGRRLNKKLADLRTNDIILDLGPKTMELYEHYLKSARTVIWNGPLGVFEKKNFAFSTKRLISILSRITKRGTFTLVGGGETVATLKKNSRSFSWVSTGGGATLAFLSGDKLPGLKKIIKP